MDPQLVDTGKVYSIKPENRRGDFTFTRSSAATRVNADGNIEKEKSNLLLQSNKLNTTWTTSDGSIAGSQSDKDGGTSAWKLTNTNPFGRVTQDVTASGVNTFSIYAKEGNNPYLRMQFQSVGSDAYFDLSDGSVISTEATIIDAGSESVGNGWYRVFASVNEAITNVRIVHTGAGAGGGGLAGDYFYLQDAQLEQGLVARDYIETTTTAVEGGITDNVPRLDYTDSSCPALLLEPLRSNLWKYSEYIGGNTLINPPIITENYAVSPEGLSNAFRIQDTTGTSYRQVRPLSSGFSVSANSTYTQSFFVKKATSAITNYGGISFDYTGGTTRKIAYVAFDEYNGTLANLTSSFPLNATLHPVEDYGDYWRFSVSATDNGDNTNLSVSIYACISTNGISTGIGIKDWTGYGLQLEAGSYATSYIPTYGSSVTRVGENFTLTGISDLIGQTEGTFFLSYSGIATTSSENNFFSLADSSGNNRFLIGIANQANKVRTYIDVDTSQTGDNYPVTDITSTTKVAMVYTESGNKVKVYINGTKEVDRTMNDTISEDLTELANNNGSGGQQAQVRLEQALVFKTALTDQQAIDLTTI